MQNRASSFCMALDFHYLWLSIFGFMDREILITEAVLGKKAPFDAGNPSGQEQAPVPRKRRKKRLPWPFRILFWMIGIWLFLSAAVSLYLYVQRDEIKQLIVDGINSQLRTPVLVQDVQLGIWQHWPMVSVSFKGVQGNSVRETDDEPLFYAQTLSLSFNLKDLYNKQYIVREIVVSGGDFNLKHYGKGENNYKIWKTRDNPDQNLRFQLRRILFRNTLVRYRDIPAKHDFQVLFRNVTARGELYAKGQEFDLEGAVDVHSMKAGGFVFLARKEARLDIRLSNNQKSKEFVLDKGLVSIEDTKFGTRGLVRYDKKSPYLEFRFRSRSMQVDHALSLLPAESRKMFDAYRFKGNIAFEMEIKGDYTQGPLTLSAGFDYTQGVAMHRESGIKAENLHLKGTFQNGGRQGWSHSRLDLEKLEATFPSGKVSGRFALHDFQSPEVFYQGNLALDIADLQQFAGIWPDVRLQGCLQGNLYFRNRFPSMKPAQWTVEDFNGMEAKGDLEFRSLSLHWPDADRLQVDSLHMNFDSKVLKTRPFVVKASGNEMHLRLFTENYMPYLMLPGQDLILTADLSSPEIDWSYWQAWFAAFSRQARESGRGKDSVSGDAGREENPEKRRTQAEDTVATGGNPSGKPERGSLRQHLYADVRLDVDRLLFPRMAFSHAKGLMHYTPGHVRIEELQVDAFQGSFSGQGELGMEDSLWNVWLDGELASVDIGSCFKAFNDFGIKKFGYENIGGRLSSDVRLSCRWDAGSRKVDPSSLSLKAGVTVKDGLLQDLEALEKLSRFTGENDLRSIRFADLQNEIEIRDGLIHIPRMEIVSDAANFSLSGLHGFDNRVFYEVDIALSDLLSRNRRQRMKAKREEEFGVVEESGGRLRLPLEMQGLLPDVEIKYAFRRARQGAKERLKEQRQRMREAFEAEYGKERMPAGGTSRQEETRQQPGSGDFIIEFPEEAGTQERGTRDTAREDSSGARKPVAQDTAKEKKKYNTEEDFRIEFEDD